ncbi:Rieske (2Fe-2S) protein [Peribacillus frigoritolerans]|uniref:Rieske (2Fe-2S) protein n=1 Tax=Peribacillus frigoritolerans TaxID=450367 RepID=UPI0024170101|nr:Rieske (2Fe-2S) protein [Peribacillus frigoritolerans]MDG4850174.1 Rieske (2Fe-2S) protein [Peribacillus frigoritolerans]
MGELKSVTVCSSEDLKPGQRQLVKVDGSEIAIFNLNGQLHAVRNKCPHQGVSMVYGSIDGTMLPSDPHTYQYGKHNEILRCPLHGWGFDIKTGESLFDAQNCKLKTYDVRQEGDIIVLYLNKVPKTVSLIEHHACVVS